MMLPLATKSASLVTNHVTSTSVWGVLVTVAWIITFLLDVASCSLNSIKVGENEDVIFMCSTPAEIPRHYIVWHKGHKSPSHLGNRFYVNHKTGSLTISKVMIADEGNYTCSAGWGQRFEPYTVTLFVSIAPHIRVTSPDPITPSVGEKHTLSCRASGRPRPTVRWYSNKELPIDDSQTEAGSRFVIEEHGASEKVLESHLVINPVFAQDRGTFACIASNVVGSDQDTVVVDVQRRPLMLSPSEDMLVYWWEGHKVNLTCQSVGNPAPLMSWTSFNEDGDPHSMPLTPIVEVLNGVVVSSTIWFPPERSYQLLATFTCRAANKYGHTDPKTFTVREGHVPPAPIVHILSIKDDELILSIDLPWHQQSPPIRYATAQYHLLEANRDMETSNVFTGNGTQLLLRGIMLYYKYIVKVKVFNMVGSSEATVLQIYSEEKTFTLHTTTLEPTTQYEVTEDTQPENTTKNRRMQRPENRAKNGDDGVRTLKSTEGNNSSSVNQLSCIFTVISLCFSIVKLLLHTQT